MIKENSKTSSAARAERSNDFVQIVGAVEEFNDDSLNTEIVSPDFLNQFGIVNAFDEQSTGASNSRGRSWHGNRP